MKYRVASGFTLEDLVDNVDLFLQRGWKPLGGVTIDQGLFCFLQAVVADFDDAEVPPKTGPEWETEAKAMCAKGRKINAIKIVRENTRLGLKEAKDLVESWGI